MQAGSRVSHSGCLGDHTQHPLVPDKEQLIFSGEVISSEHKMSPLTKHRHCQEISKYLSGLGCHHLWYPPIKSRRGSSRCGGRLGRLSLNTSSTPNLKRKLLRTAWHLWALVPLFSPNIPIFSSPDNLNKLPDIYCKEKFLY